MSESPEGGHSPERDHRLGDLDRRLKSVRGHNFEPARAERRGTQLGLAFRLATELVAGFVVGGLLGWQLDAWFGTLPLFLLVFFGLGAAAGILNVVRTAKTMNEAAQHEAAKDEATKAGATKAGATKDGATKDGAAGGPPARE